MAAKVQEITENGLDELILQRPATKREVAEPVEYWKRMQSEEGWSTAEIGREIGYDGSVVSKAFGGKYSGDMEAFVAGCRDGMRRVMGSSQGAVIDTRVGQMVNAGLDDAHGSEWLTVIYGPPGTGKTEAIRRYVRKHARSRRRRCMLVTVDQMANVRTVVSELASKLGLSARGDTSVICRAIIAELISNPYLIILDECNNACHSPRRAGSLLNTLRQINDEAACGVVLVGTSNIAQVLHDPRNKPLMEMVLSRIGSQMELTAPTEQEMRALLLAHFPGGVSDEAWEAFRAGYPAHAEQSLRRVAVFVQNARKYMDLKDIPKGSALTPAIARAAWRRNHR